MSAVNIAVKKYWRAITLWSRLKMYRRRTLSAGASWAAAVAGADIVPSSRAPGAPGMPDVW